MNGSVKPSVYLWKFSPFYSKFDEQGLPTHFPDGSPLSTVERRNIEDEFESHKRIHAEYLKVVDEVCYFIAHVDDVSTCISSCFVSHIFVSFREICAIMQSFRRDLLD
jgi:hypothetical protein